MAYGEVGQAEFIRDATGAITGLRLGARTFSGSAGLLQLANVAAFPATGAATTIYLALDTMQVYAWTGSAYAAAGGAGGGGIKVRAASTANLNLAAMPATVDGVTLTSGVDAFLAKDEITAATNGLYLFNGNGNPASRLTGFTTYDAIAGSMVSVLEGTANADKLWFCTSNIGGTLETTALAYIEIDYTDARVRATVATGLSTADATDATAADTFLAILGKFQAKWNAIATTVRNTLLTGIDTTTTGSVASTDTVAQGIGKLQATKASYNGPTTPITVSTALTSAAHANRTVLVQGTGIVLTINNDGTGGWVVGDSLWIEPVDPATDTFTVVQGSAALRTVSTTTADNAKSAGGIVSMDRVAANTWVTTSPKGANKGAMRLLAQSGANFTFPADTVDNVGATIALPALGINAKVIVRALFVGTGSSKNYRFKLNGSTFFDYGNNQNNQSLDISFQNQNSASSQFALSPSLPSDGTAGGSGSGTTLAIDTSVATTLTITCLKTVGADTITLKSYSVWIMDPDA